VVCPPKTCFQGLQLTIKASPEDLDAVHTVTVTAVVSLPFSHDYTFSKYPHRLSSAIAFSTSRALEPSAPLLYSSPISGSTHTGPLIPKQSSAPTSKLMGTAHPGILHLVNPNSPTTSCDMSSESTSCNNSEFPLHTNKAISLVDSEENRHSASTHSPVIVLVDTPFREASSPADDDSGCAEMAMFRVAGRIQLETSRAVCSATNISQLGPSSKICPLQTPIGHQVTRPAYQLGLAFLSSDKARILASSSESIPRYFSTTITSSCVPSILQQNANSVIPHSSEVSIDHACGLFHC
jgi:hypothetical protein